jgi:hypothetical protein
VTRTETIPGYVYIDDQGRATLLAAADPRTAQTLLWGLAARLDLEQLGYLAVRGMTDPAPYAGTVVTAHWP